MGAGHQHALPSEPGAILGHSRIGSLVSKNIKAEMNILQLVLLCVTVALLFASPLPGWLQGSGAAGNAPPDQQSVTTTPLFSAALQQNAASMPSQNWSDIMQMFPHVQHCGFGSPQHWMHDYAKRHAATVQSMAYSDAAQQRLMVSIPHLSGTADQVISMVTQYWLAVLNNRSFTQFVPEGRAKSFGLACDFPFFNWTHPVALPEFLLKPLPTGEVREYSDPNTAVIYPAPYHNYAFHNMVNPVRPRMALFSTEDLKNFPVNMSHIPIVLTTSNRGLTYRMLTNPHHKVEFWDKFNVRPETAFMCGFWSLCSPNRAVQEYYAEKFWKPMSQPDVLKIGIQVRLGDNVTFFKNTPWTEGKQIRFAAPYFACAQLLERAYAKKGQKVLWYLLSDSAVVRRTAKYMYPGKVLTDDEVELVHVTCYRNDDPKTCEDATLKSAIQHAVGEMLTFSMANYHVTTQSSGFGRVGSWLSGQWDNKFELPLGVSNAAHICPGSPILANISSDTFSGI